MDVSWHSVEGTEFIDRICYEKEERDDYVEWLVRQQKRREAAEEKDKNV